MNGTGGNGETIDGEISDLSVQKPVDPINGTVVDQNGDPVPNASVRVYGFDYNQFNGTQSEIESEIASIRADLNNVAPPKWDRQASNYDVTEQFDSKSGSKYIAAHSLEDWELNGKGSFTPGDAQRKSNPTLSEPQIQFDEGQTIALSIWHPRDEEWVEDSVDDDLMGKTESGTVQITQLGPGGEEMQTMERETQDIVGIRSVDNALSPKTHEAVVLDLQPGFYEVSPKGTPPSYVITVGDPDEMLTGWEEDLEDKEKALINQSDRIDSLVTDNKLSPTTIQADENGTFTYTPDSSTLESVSFVAYTAPDGVTDPQNATRADVRAYYDNLDVREIVDGDAEYPGTVYVQTEPANAAPGTNVTIPTRKVDAPNFMNASKYENMTDYLVDLFLSDANRAEVLLRQVNPSDAEISAARVQLCGLAKENDEVSEETLATLEDDLPSYNESAFCEPAVEGIPQEELDQLNATLTEIEGLLDGKYEDRVAEIREMIDNAETVEDLNETQAELDALESDLRDDGETGAADDVDAISSDLASTTDEIAQQHGQELEALQSTIAALQTTIELLSQDTSVDNDGNLNGEFVFPGEISEDAVAVHAHHSDGTSETIPDEYVDVETNFVASSDVRRTTVTVSDYPIPDGVASSTLEVDVATADGIGGGETKPVTNPLVGTDPPEIDAVRLGSQKPGPDERVPIEVRPSADSDFRSLTNVTVYDPAGNTIQTATIENGKESHFTTNGEGRHTIRLTYETTDGTQFVRTFNVMAGSVSTSRPPSVAARSGPTGQFVLAANGIDGGSVDTEGDDVRMTSCVDDRSDAPTSMHAYLTDISNPADGTTTVRVLECGSEKSIDKRVTVTMHVNQLDEDAHTYRESSTPINDNEFGSVTHRSDHATIRTYTGEDGSVSVRVNNDPGYIDEALWYVRNRRIPGVGYVPIWVGTPDLGFMSDLPTFVDGLPLGLVAIGIARRRRGGGGPGPEEPETRDSPETPAAHRTRADANMTRGDA